MFVPVAVLVLIKAFLLASGATVALNFLLCLYQFFLSMTRNDETIMLSVHQVNMMCLRLGVSVFLFYAAFHI